MPFPYIDQAHRAHRELLAEGKIKRRDSQEDVEHDKGLLTQRTGYYANIADRNIGVLEKSSGNRYQPDPEGEGYSVDIVIAKAAGGSGEDAYEAGHFWDIVTDRDGLATVIDGGPSGPDTGLIPRWRQPTAALAQVEGEPGNGGGGNGGGGEPPSDECCEAVKAEIAELKALVVSLTEIVTAQNDEVAKNTVSIADIQETLNKGFAGQARLGVNMTFAMKPLDQD